MSRANWCWRVTALWAAEYSLAVEVVKGLAGGLADLSGDVFDLANDAVCGALVGEVLVAGEIAYAFLDGSSEGTDFALGLFFRAPRERFTGGVGEAIVAGVVVGVEGWLLLTVEDKDGNGDTNSNTGKYPGKLHGKNPPRGEMQSEQVRLRKKSAGGGGLAERLEIVVEHTGEVHGEAGALGVGVGAEGALELDVGFLAGDLFGAGGCGEVGGGEADGALGGGLLLDDDVERAVGLGGGVDDGDAAEGGDGLADLAGDGAGGVVASYGEEDVDLARGHGPAGGADEPVLFGIGPGGVHEVVELDLGELREAVGLEVVGGDAEGFLDVGRPRGHG